MFQKLVSSVRTTLSVEFHHLLGMWRTNNRYIYLVGLCEKVSLFSLVILGNRLLQIFFLPSVLSPRVVGQLFATDMARWTHLKNIYSVFQVLVVKNLRTYNHFSTFSQTSCLLLVKIKTTERGPRGNERRWVCARVFTDDHADDVLIG